MTCNCINWLNANDYPYYEWSIGDITFNDPVQSGCAHNCSLIAAFSSIAFVQPGLLKKTKVPVGPNKDYYPLKFYDPGNVQNYCLYYVKPTLCLDSSNNYIYARSNTSNEIWPAIWEKGYAAYRLHLLRLDPPNKPYSDKAQIDTVDYSLLETYLNNPSSNWGGNPIIALLTLTGAGSANQFEPNRVTADKICDDICNVSINCGSTTWWRVISAKMVAWTPPGSYDTTLGIQENHSYALLGMIWDGKRSSTAEIILHSSIPTAAPAFNWCVTGGCETIKVPMAEFQQYFEWYGWVAS